MPRTKIMAEVTGTVCQILLEPGTEVGPDDAILIVESMKMEIPVIAARAGRLAEVLVREGDSVKDGQVVAVLET